MYVITVLTPANANPNKMVKTYYCKETTYQGVRAVEWDEDIHYAAQFTDKVEAKKIMSKLKLYKGTENCKVEFAKKFSKN